MLFLSFFLSLFLSLLPEKEEEAMLEDLDGPVEPATASWEEVVEGILSNDMPTQTTTEGPVVKRLDRRMAMVLYRLAATRAVRKSRYTGVTAWNTITGAIFIPSHY